MGLYRLNSFILECRRVLRVTKKPDSFEYKTYDQGHGYSEPVWNAENNWMDRWLRNGDSPLTIYSERFDAELTCFPNGEPADMAHVETAFTQETPQWNIENMNDFNGIKDSLMNGLRNKIIRTAFLPIESEMETTINDSTADYIVEQKQLSINGGTIVHNGYYLYKPNEKRKTVILISKNNIDIWNLKDLYKNSYLPNGFNLYCLEITGTGHNPWITEDHWKLSRFAELCGHTRASLQINDILAAIDNVKNENSVDSTAVYLWGEGDIAVPVLYCSIVNETNVAGVILQDAPDEHVGITPVIDSWCHTALFNILKYADIPQAAGLIYPRTIILNGNNKSGFDWTENMYSNLDNSGNFDKMDGSADEVLKKINMITSVKKKLK